jgi:hypothetical protein
MASFDDIIKKLKSSTRELIGAGNLVGKDFLPKS